MGGTAGEEPVAMQKRCARIACRRRRRCCLSAKRPAAWMTCTPSPVKRSTLSFGAMAAITDLHVVVDGARVDLRVDGTDAERAPRCASGARGGAAAISAFEGTQP